MLSKLFAVDWIFQDSMAAQYVMVNGLATKLSGFLHEV
jgi:hypothetical protein